MWYRFETLNYYLYCHSVVTEGVFFIKLFKMMTGKERKINVKPWDAAIFLFVLVLTVLSFFYIYKKQPDISRVLIESRDQIWVFPLDAEEIVNVQGPLGTTVIRIHKNQAWVESSPCKNKICLGAGCLKNNWEFAACLPNNVLLMIEGNNETGEIDSYAW
jgi:hypothetical protein